jgi:hypothetical protein
MCRKLGPAVLVGIRFLQDFKCRYTEAFLIILAGVLLRSYCDICNKVACVVIRFGDSIVQYSVAPELDNCSLSSISVYFHNVL